MGYAPGEVWDRTAPLSVDISFAYQLFCHARSDWSAVPPWPVFNIANWLLAFLDRLRNAITPPPIRILDMALSFTKSQVSRCVEATCAFLHVAALDTMCASEQCGYCTPRYDNDCLIMEHASAGAPGPGQGKHRRSSGNWTQDGG